jgi:hypothetical protein
MQDRVCCLERSMLVMVLAVGLVAAGSCSRAPGPGPAPRTLDELMRQYGFTPLSPPQTGWEVGSFIELSAESPEFPELRIMAENLGLHCSTVTNEVASQSALRTEVRSLSGAAGIPALGSGDLARLGVRSYTIETRGNAIIRGQMDEMFPDPFLLPNATAERWQELARTGALQCVYALWSAEEIAFQFADSAGSTLDLRVLTNSLSLSGCSWNSSQQVLVYKGPTPMILGYKARQPRLTREPCAPKSQPDAVGGGGGCWRCLLGPA